MDPYHNWRSGWERDNANLICTTIAQPGLGEIGLELLEETSNIKM